MKIKKTAGKKQMVCSVELFCLLVLGMLVSGCSSHDKQFSYFNMLDEKKRTLSNKQAAAKFWSSVRPVSTLSDSHYKLGRHYQRKNEYDKAIKEFAKALRNDNTYCKAYNGIAMSYDALRRCEAAHASYAQALQCAPDQAYVYNNYACSSLLCGNFGQGVTLLLKAEQLAGDNTRIKNNLRIAQKIEVRKNISDYLSGGQVPLPVTEPVSALPLTESEKTLIAPVYAIPEQSLQTVSKESDINDIPAGNDPPPPSAAPTVETSVTFTPSAAPYDADPVKLIAEKSKRIVFSDPTIPLLRTASVAIEVSNGNGATGMAGRSADFLRGRGFKVRSITNAKHFRFEESIIFYKEGYLEVAKELATIIPGAQNLEKVESMGKASIGVRVLLGRDLVVMRFPEGVAGLAGLSDPKTEHLLTATVSVSNNLVHY